MLQGMIKSSWAETWQGPDLVINRERTFDLKQVGGIPMDGLLPNDAMCLLKYEQEGPQPPANKLPSATSNMQYSMGQRSHQPCL